jgi:hypothetical protein
MNNRKDKYCLFIQSINRGIEEVAEHGYVAVLQQTSLAIQISGKHSTTSSHPNLDPNRLNCEEKIEQTAKTTAKHPAHITSQLAAKRRKNDSSFPILPAFRKL